MTTGTGRGASVALALVRHGATPMTPTGAYSGSSVPGPSLTEHGRAQARAAAGVLARIGGTLFDDLPPPSLLVASPMVRTQETAQILAAELDGLTIRTDERARECDFGQWEGRTEAEIDERWPGELDTWHTTGTSRPPGGESIAEVGARTGALMADLLATHAGRTVAVVAHAVAIRSMVGQCLLAPPGAWWRLRLEAGSVSVLELFADGLAKVHVAGLPSEA